MRKLENYEPTRFMSETSSYNEEYADHAVKFIESLCHTKGKWFGKKFDLIDWQEQIVRDLFGIIKPNGFRQFNTAYVEIPKKQGKSELAAAFALLLTCGDFEQRAEVYGCAADTLQASIVFDVAMDMVLQNRYLLQNIKILKASRKMIYLPTGSVYKVLSADAKTKHGFNVHGVVFDELHTQPNRSLFDVMTKGSGFARTQPLYFLITTAGDSTTSIGFETHKKAKDILEGRKIDPSFYPVIYGAEQGDDWTAPDTWKKANPSLGITVDIEQMEIACNSARQNPAEENAFRQLHLNQWVKQTVRWISLESWDLCNSEVDIEKLKGKPCYGGLDLASTEDLTAFVLVFPPEEENGLYYVLPLFWLPEDTLYKRVKKDNVPYEIWERQGFLQKTEGNVLDYSAVRKKIIELGSLFNIKEIAFDEWNATSFVQDLEGEGFNMIKFRQGTRSMSPPTKELLRLTLKQQIAHGGHPVLRWNMDNLHVKHTDMGDVKPVKERNSEKIDGVVAMVMALDRAMLGGGEQPSIYKRRGLITF